MAGFLRCGGPVDAPAHRARSTTVCRPLLPPPYAPLMIREVTFVAALLHGSDHSRDRVVELPHLTGGGPPIRVRMPSTFGGAPAWEVYELISDDGWPSRVAYRHVALEPSTQPHDR